MSTGLARQSTITVEAALTAGGAWTRTYGGFDWEPSPCVFSTPDPLVLGARAYARTIFINVVEPDNVIDFKFYYLTSAASDLSGGRMFLATHNVLHSFDGTRILWRSNLASDGVRDLRYLDGRVYGVGSGPFDADVPFDADADTGEVDYRV